MRKFSEQIAKLETQFERGLITRLDLVDQLQAVTRNALAYHMETYTVEWYLDGGMLNDICDVPLDEVEDAMHCYYCEGILADSVREACAQGCDSVRFLEDLKAHGRAITIEQADGQTHMAVAYKTQ